MRSPAVYRAIRVFQGPREIRRRTIAWLPPLAELLLRSAALPRLYIFE
jgi:hypothetical protein